MAIAKAVEVKEADKAPKYLASSLFALYKNTGARRYEFSPRKEGFSSYTVGFDEVNSDEEAWEALQNALNLKE